jgi:hypothetical protein
LIEDLKLEAIAELELLLDLRPVNTNTVQLWILERLSQGKNATRITPTFCSGQNTGEYRRVGTASGPASSQHEYSATLDPGKALPR